MFFWKKLLIIKLEPSGVLLWWKWTPVDCATATSNLLQQKVLLNIGPSSNVECCTTLLSRSVPINQRRWLEIRRVHPIEGTIDCCPTTTTVFSDQVSPKKYFFWPSDDRLRREGEKTLPQNFIGLLVPGKNSRKKCYFVYFFFVFSARVFRWSANLPKIFSMASTTRTNSIRELWANMLFQSFTVFWAPIWQELSVSGNCVLTAMTKSYF